MTRILNFGSLNIDHVYSVNAIARPGETIQSLDYQVFAGGKGGNQSAALARAGARVFHAGRIGPDGVWLRQKLTDYDVDVDAVVEDADTPTGHAIIQVEAQGENSIVLFPGANLRLTDEQIDDALERFDSSDYLLIQNETNQIEHLINSASKRSMRVCLNPSPFTQSVADYPLSLVDVLIVNQIEAEGLSGSFTDSKRQVQVLHNIIGHGEVVLTLGVAGSVYFDGSTILSQQAVTDGPVVDTTGAGDTFLGFFLAATVGRENPECALRRASAAAALCVARPGAMDSIPKATEIDSKLDSR